MLLQSLCLLTTIEISLSRLDLFDVPVYEMKAGFMQTNYLLLVYCSICMIWSAGFGAGDLFDMLRGKKTLTVLYSMID
jgi:hypothetical protein